MANGINICSAFFLSFGCLSWVKKSRDMKKEFKNSGSARTSKGRARVQAKRQTDEMKKAATGREKYVKINWKSIECDVKIKFIRAATSAEIAMGIYFVDSPGSPVDVLRSEYFSVFP